MNLFDNNPEQSGDTAEFDQQRLPAVPKLSRIEQLEDLRNSLNRIWSAASNEYKDVTQQLEQREVLLQLAHPYFRDAANRVVKIITNRANGVVQHSALDLEIDAAVRGELVSLLNSVPQELKDLWLGLPEGIDKSERLLQLTQVFYWSLSRMIEFAVDADSSRVPHIEVRNRGMVDGEPAPYALHTCVDLPFAVSNILNLRSSESWKAALQIAMEWAHDTKEVGKQLKWVEGRFTEGTVSLDDLSSQLPLRRLGQKLEVGIEILTESELDEISEFNPKAVSEYEKKISKYVKQCSKEYKLEVDPWITKILLRDPIVFGGLAMQVKLAVNMLCNFDASVRYSGLSTSAACDLAETICSTESGDRVADMFTLERHIEQHKSNPSLMRFKILAYCSRMLNMYEKLVESSEKLSADKQPAMQRALRSYLAVLAVKFDQMNQQIPDGTERIRREDLLKFYQNVFIPIQNAADEVSAPFVEHKLQRVLRNSIQPVKKNFD